jgi:hypothetical protein
MFPFSSKNDAVLVQPLYRSGNIMGFACESMLDTQVDLKVRDRDGHLAQVHVQQRRRADDQNWIYFAELREGALQPESSLPSYQWRQADRYPIGVRVRSPRLPEYTALTDDLSAEGAQLSPGGPLQVGDEIELHLDLDCGFPALCVLGRVCWSKLTTPWRAGVAFVDLQPEQQRVLTSYLSQRQGDDVPGLATADSEPRGIEAPTLEKLAYLQSSFDDGDTLVLNLLTHDEVVEIRFQNARVLQTNLCSQLVGNILSKPTPDNTTRTLLIDPHGTTLIEIESAAPEILCRGLPAG